jgi:hypothetical protein
VTAGAVIRRRVRRELERSAMDAHVDIDIREDKGWFDSVFYVKGKGVHAPEWWFAVRAWMDGLAR